jgi:Cu/Ag efflux pump CusA
MSIPRIAIQRPVTMFMISAVVILLGTISLARLPVDLMPDVTYPSITVRVGYGGVGPQEIEELIVRPLEQSLAAVHRQRGLGPGAAQLRVGIGSERVGRRSPVARRSRARPAA